MGNDFDTCYFKDIGDHQVKDLFGVVWDRAAEEGMGTVKGCLLPEATLKGYEFPDPSNAECFADIPEAIAKSTGQFRMFMLPFLLFLRATYLRGMTDLMLDFYDHPKFVHELFTGIMDYNIAQAKIAVSYDIDSVYMGDDWGQQIGLIMGPKIWREFIYPQIKRLYAAVRDGGKVVYIHSCGDVDEILGDLIDIGVQVYNPFQPEVMNVEEVFKRHGGQLAFHGGLSNQQTLPFGSVEKVREVSGNLLKMGRDGSYIFSASNSVSSDTPLANILAMFDLLHQQAGYRP